MNYTDEDRTIAISGIFQAAALTRALGRDGKAPETAFQASLFSLFQLDAPDVQSVFKGVAGLALGLTTLKTQMLNAHARDIELTRYFIALLHLEAKLTRQDQRLDEIGKAIAALDPQAQNTPDRQAQVISELADIYLNHISRLSPRIMVKGEALYLQNDRIAAQIRTSLLAGIRATRLWRQVGGRRWHLLLRRKQILRCANRLLDHIEATSDMV